MSDDLLSAILPGIIWLLFPLILISGYRKEGIFPLSSVFFWLLLGLYLVYIPLADRMAGVRESYGFSLPFNDDINWRISRVYAFAILGFGSGLMLANALWRGKVFSLFILKEGDSGASIRFLYGLQLLVWVVYMINLSLSGISLFSIFNPFSQREQDILFAAAFRFPLLELLAASVPVCLFLLMLLKQARRPIWWIFFIFWLTMSLLGGWRFRIILFVLFCLLHFASGPLSLRKWIPYLIAGISGMAWLTLNRMAIAKRQFGLITFDLSQFDFSVFNNEFSNSRTFRACLSQPGWDTFPGISGWMKVFPGENPWILSFSKSWIPPGWPWNPNPALSQPEEFYLLFGLAGMFVLMAGLGFLCSWLDRLRLGFWSNAFRIVFTALLFQWISRGYFPFQLKISLICLLPFLLLRIAGPYLSVKSNEYKA